MAVIYRTSPVQGREASDVLVIHCSDPRFQPHFQEFLHRSLGLERYALIAVPGGAQFLTLTEYLPKFPWVGWRWMKFLIGLVRPDRCILVAHDDCRWYASLRFWHDATRLQALQVEDLRRVRSSLAERFGIPRIELYFARLTDGRAEFEAV